MKTIVIIHTDSCVNPSALNRFTVKYLYLCVNNETQPHVYYTIEHVFYIKHAPENFFRIYNKVNIPLLYRQDSIKNKLIKIKKTSGKLTYPSKYYINYGELEVFL